MLKSLSAFVLSLLTLFACTEMSVEQLEQAMQGNVHTGSNSVESLINTDAEIIVFGENHYVDEHSSFIADYIDAAFPNESIRLLEETGAAMSLILNNWVQGKTALPNNAKLYATDYSKIEALKTLNSTRHVDQQISYFGIDMNHDVAYFRAYNLLGD